MNQRNEFGRNEMEGILGTLKAGGEKFSDWQSLP